MNEKALKVLELAKSQLGYPYVFGAVGEDCTPAKRGRRQSTAHPTIKSKCQVLNGTKSNCGGCKWQGARMFDCRGFTYWCLKQVGIKISTVGATTQYNTAADWMQRGEIADMPDVVCCVFKKSGNKMMHTGLHIGGGVIIHCSNGVQYGKTTDKGWTHYAIPAGLYTEEELQNASQPENLGSVSADNAQPVLRKGSTGEAVKTAQRALVEAGYLTSTPGVDGIFGAQTENAVKNFQGSRGLTADGIVGKLTWEALNAVLTKYDPAETPVFSVYRASLTDEQAKAIQAAFPDIAWEVVA